MIFTLTLNPSIDYYMDIDSVSEGNVNRSRAEKFVFGGKGINVSRMLSNLGVKSTAAAVAGGFTGRALVDGVRAEGIDIIHIPAKGNTRINVKLSKTNTELNGAGVCADNNTAGLIKEAFSGAAKGDIVVMSGSLCRGIVADFYADFISELNKRGVLCVVDADGEALERAVHAEPFLIKPNHIELGRLLGEDISDEQDAAIAVRLLINAGVKNVLVSMGGKGAVFANADHEIYMPAPAVKAVNTVGAGDCMLAGFIYAFINDMPYRDCLKFAVSCGSAAVKTGHCPDAEAVYSLFK